MGTHLAILNGYFCKRYSTLHDLFNFQYHEIHTVFHEISLIILTEVKRAVGGGGEFHMKTINQTEH
jgi:hypothetical protein